MDSTTEPYDGLLVRREPDGLEVRRTVRVHALSDLFNSPVRGRWRPLIANRLSRPDQRCRCLPTIPPTPDRVGSPVSFVIVPPAETRVTCLPWGTDPFNRDRGRNYSHGTVLRSTVDTRLTFRRVSRNCHLSSGTHRIERRSRSSSPQHVREADENWECETVCRRVWRLAGKDRPW